MLTKYQQGKTQDQMEDRKGISLIFWLTVAFVIAKLAGLIAWSWWLVFSPLWISAAICISLLIVLAIIAIIIP